jgi:hypothetical protein
MLILDDSRNKLPVGRFRRGKSDGRDMGVGGRTGSSWECSAVSAGFTGVGRWIRTEAAVLAATRSELGCLSMFMPDFPGQFA